MPRPGRPPTPIAAVPGGHGMALGARLRAARLRAGLTQAALAGERYTKAHVSALEHGLAQPSMEALAYFAERLGVSPADLVASPAGSAWPRVEADLALATGAWSEAAARYGALLTPDPTGIARAGILVGLAEARCRLDQGREALPVAAEAAALFEHFGRHDRAAEARYWQACAAYEMDAGDDARALLSDLADKARPGGAVEPDLRLRALIALGATASRDGYAERALAHLEAARALSADLDDRRRAAFLHGLAGTYRELGDLDTAVALGTHSLALYRAAAGEAEVAAMENELALVHLALGRADEAAAFARAATARATALADERLLAHAVETAAQLELAAGRAEAAAALAAEAMAHARASHNRKAEVSAGLTMGRARRAQGEIGAAAEAFDAAAAAARRYGRRVQLQDALTEQAELAAAAGDHARAYELTRDALREIRP